MQNQSSYTGATGSVVEPAATQPFGPGAPGSAPRRGTGPVGSNPNGQAPAFKPHSNVVETIILVIVSFLAVIFLGLFIWKFMEWDAIKTDVDGQIDEAVAIAVSENTTKMENEFLEREKYPYKTFAGPADYGSLGFEYPKTWNVYIAKDAANGGDFEAYLNPGEVQSVSSTTINALRVTIKDSPFDTVVKTYDSLVKSGKVTIATRNVGSTIANVYTGELPNKIQGIVTLFKVRDKTVILQTDAMIFSEEYYKLLDTVNFVE